MLDMVYINLAVFAAQFKRDYDISDEERQREEEEFESKLEDPLIWEIDDKSAKHPSGRLLNYMRNWLPQFMGFNREWTMRLVYRRSTKGWELSIPLARLVAMYDKACQNES